MTSEVREAAERLLKWHEYPQHGRGEIYPGSMYQAMKGLEQDTVTVAKAVCAANPADDEEAIWTDDQVFQLNANQHRGDIHPYTCGNDSRHRPLIATRHGWRCADCDYRQDWAHGIGK